VSNSGRNGPRALIGMLTVEQPPFLLCGGSLHCFRGGAPQGSIRKDGMLNSERPTFCDAEGHLEWDEEEDEGAMRDGSFDDDSDDEDVDSPNWRGASRPLPPPPPPPKGHH